MFGAVGCGVGQAGGRCRVAGIGRFGFSMPCAPSSGRLPPVRWSAWSAFRPIGSASFTRSGRGREWNGLRGLSRWPVSRLRVRCRSIRREAGSSVDLTGPGWCCYATGRPGSVGSSGVSRGVPLFRARRVLPRARVYFLVLYTFSDTESAVSGLKGCCSPAQPVLWCRLESAGLEAIARLRAFLVALWWLGAVSRLALL